ncbi:MAG TPA: AAA family ATPase [Micromonosporaceae bacterium]
MSHSRSIRPVGRDAVLDRARAHLGAGGSVLLYGPPGIGKSMLLDALSSGYDGARVLRAAAAEAESGLPYLALVDLFDGVPTDAVPLPQHLRAALDAALLRGDVPGAAQDQLAVRLAVLELLRGLAAQQPLLLVMDDVQWIDEPSVGVLRFVARRLAGGNVRLLCAERVDLGAAPATIDLCPAPCLELSIPPLTESDLADMLRVRFGPSMTLPATSRVYAASGGNPLFAMELGRALAERDRPVGPGEPLPVPGRLRTLLHKRLASLPPSSAPVLLLVAAAARPTRALLAELAGDEVGGGLAAAVSAGVVDVEPDGVIRFRHPLLREMVYADADPAARALAHERLAAIVVDSVERARHLALARPFADEALASTLAEAAAVARRRGAPAVAADLAERAADRTPPRNESLASARRLEAARQAYAAGLTADAVRLANAALHTADDPAVRVKARLLLVDLAGQDQSGAGPLLDAAFVDADGQPALLAQVRLYRAMKAYFDGDTASATAELKRAEEAAEQSGDTERLVEVLTSRGMIETPVGAPESDELLARAAALSRGLPLSSAVVGARQSYAMARLFRGDVAEAVRGIEALRMAVERSGTVRDLALVLLSVASVYSRAGRCADALAAGQYCQRLYLDIEATPGPGLLVGALVELGGGSVVRAAQLADQAIEASRAARDDDWLRGAYATRGQVYLLEGDPAAAVGLMREAYAIEQRLGRTDPAIFLWHADLVEALVATGARAEAATVLGEVTGHADRLGRDVVRLSLARGRALVTAGDGGARAAADELSAALRRWADHPYPMELARAWHTLGGLERRAHRRSAARAALVEAINRYTACQAAPWLAAARAELARLDGGRGAGLSETEQRIVDLVRAGATNREIARATYLSVKAVEANLTRLYRRLGVRNRAQLTRLLDESGSSD